jgi:anti-sigma factor RsiW
MAHLGSRVSALVDGRLTPEEEERCWEHVHGCHACRDLVEQEGRIKTQLARLSFGPSACSRDLKAVLLGGWSTLTPRPFATYHHRPRRGLVALGGGAASACVVGVLALGVAGAPRTDPRPPATDLSRPTGPATSVGTVDDRSARGPMSTSRTPLAERLVAIREKIAP